MATKRQLEFACYFANWCKREGLDPVDVKELAILVQQRSSAATRVCNYPDSTGTLKKRDNDLIQRIREKAKSMKLKAFFPGLYACFERIDGKSKGAQLHLPLDF